MTHVVRDDIAHIAQEAATLEHVLPAYFRSNNLFEFDDKPSKQESEFYVLGSFLVSHGKDQNAILAYPSLGKIFLKHSAAVL